MHCPDAAVWGRLSAFSLFPHGPLCSAAGTPLAPGGSARPWGPGGSAFLFPLQASSNCRIGGGSITSTAASTRLNADRAQGTYLSLHRHPRNHLCGPAGKRVWGWGQFLGVPDHGPLQPGLSPTNCDSGRSSLQPCPRPSPSCHFPHSPHSSQWSTHAPWYVAI